MCIDDSVRFDLVTESPNVGDDGRAIMVFLLALFASPFKLKRRLETENAALRHQLAVLRRRDNLSQANKLSRTYALLLDVRAGVMPPNSSSTRLALPR